MKLSDNRYVAGVSIEEAAYVSIEPIQNALAIANTAYGNDFKVEAVWTLSKTKKQLEATTSSSSAEFPLLEAFKRKSQQTQDESFIPLPLSSIQVLAQFAVDGSIPIQQFNGRGDKEVNTLSDSAQCIPTFAQPLVTKSVDLSKRMSYV